MSTTIKSLESKTTMAYGSAYSRITCHLISNGGKQMWGQQTWGQAYVATNRRGERTVRPDAAAKYDKVNDLVFHLQYGDALAVHYGEAGALA